MYQRHTAQKHFFFYCCQWKVTLFQYFKISKPFLNLHDKIHVSSLNSPGYTKWLRLLYSFTKSVLSDTSGSILGPVASKINIICHIN